MLSLLYILNILIGAFAAITIHEYVKALISYKLGDPLPKARGRLTLNPLNHFEPIGFICMVFTGYGWGKPVPTSPTHYKDRKKGILLTYVSPSIANLAVGIALSMIAKLVYMNMVPTTLSESVPPATMFWYASLSAIANANVALAFFNVIPVNPLDGIKILKLYLSPQAQVKYAAYEQIFQVILLIALFTGWIGMILHPLQKLFL